MLKNKFRKCKQSCRRVHYSFWCLPRAKRTVSVFIFFWRLLHILQCNAILIACYDKCNSYSQSHISIQSAFVSWDVLRYYLAVRWIRKDWLFASTIHLTLFLMMQPQTSVTLPRQINFVNHKTSSKPHIKVCLTPKCSQYHRSVQISAVSDESLHLTRKVMHREMFLIVFSVCL